MNIDNILVLAYLFVLSYIFNYVILLQISAHIYTSIITSLLVITIVDGFNLIDEKDKLCQECRNMNKLLDLQIIENEKLNTAIKAFKKT